MSSTGDLFQQWRAADCAAHALEKEIRRALLQALNGQCEAPSADEQDRARRLRHTADDLFHLAMAQMKQRAEDSHH